MYRFVFFDLDGTLVDTNDSCWTEIKFGRERFDARHVPLMRGVLHVIASLIESGLEIWLISDAAESYVRKLALHLGFGDRYLSNCGKPNTKKFLYLLQNRLGFHANDVRISEECIFIGDTYLDIYMARRIGMKSAVVDPDYRSSNRAKSTSLGSTYIVKSLEGLLDVIKRPEQQRLALESEMGLSSACLMNRRFEGGGKIIVRGLARQLRGAGDWHGALAFYNQFHQEVRDEHYLGYLAWCCSKWIDHVIKSSAGSFDWSLITWAPDKKTTKPPNKMRDFAASLEIELEKVQLFSWNDGVEGSVRKLSTYADRANFLNENLHLIDTPCFKGRDVILIDDQFTTGATAIKMAGDLIDRGARNVLVATLFYITDDVLPGITCPRCNLDLLIKTHKKTGDRFLSCSPKKYGNTVDGCGWTGNL